METGGRIRSGAPPLLAGTAARWHDPDLGVGASDGASRHLL